MRTVSFFFLFFLSNSAVFAATLTYPQVLQQSLEKSPILKAEKERVKISELELKNRLNGVFPSLDLSSSHGVGTSIPKSATDPWQSGFQLKLTENLYDNGQTWIRYDQGKVLRENAELIYQRERDYLVYEITRLYMEYSKTQKIREAKNTQKELLDKQYETVSGQYKQGLKTKRDYLRFRAQSQRADIDLRMALNAEEKLRLQIVKAAGLFEDVNDKLNFQPVEPPEIKTVPKDPPQVEKTYEVKLARLQTEVRKQDANLASRKYWPELNLLGGAYYQNDSYINSRRPFNAAEGYGWNVLVQLNYNIWDWGTRRNDVEKANSQTLISEHDLRKTTLEMSAETKSLFRDITDQSKNLEVSDELLKAQEEAYRVIRKDYSEGRVEYQDLMTSLTDLLDAKTRFYSARYDLSVLLSKFKYYEGNLYASLDAKK